MQFSRIYPLLIVVSYTFCAGVAYSAGWSSAWNYDVTWGSDYVTNVNAIMVTDTFTESTTDSNIVEHYVYHHKYFGTTFYFKSYTGTTYQATSVYYVYPRYLFTNAIETTTVSTATYSYMDGFGNLQYITNVMTREMQGGSYEIHIDVHERRQLELYEALYERGVRGNYITFGMNSLYENTATLKAMMLVALRQYCNTSIVAQTVITNWNQNDSYSVVTNGGSVVTNVHPALYWNSTSILYAASAPSNYFKYTPRKTPSRTLGYGRVVTTCVEIIRYSYETNVPTGGTLTNQVILYNGTVTNIYGAEGTTQCVSVINTNVLEGFTDNEYTYWLMTNLIGKLTHVAAYGSGYTGVNTTVYGYINSNTNNTRTRTKYISYSYSDYHYPAVPWYHYCYSPLCPGDTCSSNDNYSSTPSFVYETTSYTGSIINHLEYKISGQRYTSTSESDTDYDCDGGSSFTETVDYSGAQLDFQYYYNRVGSYAGYFGSITGAKTGSVMNVMVADYYLFHDNKATRTYSNKNVYSISYSSNYVRGCGDYYCNDSSICVPDIYGQPSETNYIVYNQNANPLYQISDSNYCLAKSYYGAEIVPTGSSYTIELDLAEPYSEAQLASEYAFSTLEEYNISASSSPSCITDPGPYPYWGTYCSQYTGSGYYKKEHTTYYVDASIESIRHIINYAVPNGFKYY